MSSRNNSAYDHPPETYEENLCKKDTYERIITMLLGQQYSLDKLHNTFDQFSGRLKQSSGTSNKQNMDPDINVAT
jgi:hypothetical protein